MIDGGGAGLNEAGFSRQPKRAVSPGLCLLARHHLFRNQNASRLDRRRIEAQGRCLDRIGLFGEPLHQPGEHGHLGHAVFRSERFHRFFGPGSQFDADDNACSYGFEPFVVGVILTRWWRQ